MEVSIATSERTFIDVSDWLSHLDRSYERFRNAGWQFITILRDGVDQFGRTDHAKAELYELASQQIGVATRSLQTYVSAARSPVASIAMELNLTFSHARAALGLDIDAANDLLSTAAEQGWTPEQVSREAWIKKTSQHTLRSESASTDAIIIADDYDLQSNQLAENEYTYTWTPDVQAGRAEASLKTFFRYPGGKSKIAGALVNEIVSLAKDGNEYREPFTGGGGVFLPVLASGAFRRFWVNDYDYGIYCVWMSVKSFHKELVDRVCKFVPAVDSFYAFRDALTQDCKHFHPAEVALMKIAVHQMSYSGLGTRAGGPIGGAGQKSRYDVGCRWNATNIVEQICAIHDAMRRVDMVITNLDWRALMDGGNVVMYLDPPYYEQGANLYHVTFTEQDHKQLSESLRKARFPWLLSYDKCDDVRGLYAWANMRETEEIHYSIALKNGNTGKQSRFASEYLIAGGGY